MMPRTSRPATLVMLAVLAGLTACGTRENSLGPGQSTSDRTPPTVTSTVPEDLSTAIPRSGSITFTFSEPVIPASVASAITFSPAASGMVSYTGNTATFTPSAPLAPTTIYTATISTNVEDIAGNNLVAPFSWTFTTAP